MAIKKLKQQDQRITRQRRQEWLVIAMGVGIIAASVATTLWLSGFFARGGEEKYQNVTFTDAVVRCEARARDTFQGQLRLLTLDDHSSRFDQGAFAYKVFFNAQMADPKGEGAAAEYFINCFVSAEGGRIATFDLYQQKESQTEALRQDDGGLFGWPLKGARN